MAEPIYSLENVSYTYPGGVPAIVGLNLAIGAGDRTAIIGANGTGKSTLLTILDALVYPEKGAVTAFGEPLTVHSLDDPSRQRAFRQRAAFVFQNPDVQLFCSTVREDIVFGPLHLGVEKAEISRRLDRVVEQLHLGRLLDRSPHQLSIGEKKKVAIASVLAVEPDVLLLDEPTAGLDPQTTRDIIQIIFDYHKEGKSVVMATHDLHIVEEIADIVHVFGASRSIIRSGPPAEILSDEVFLQENNLQHIHVHRHLHTSHTHPHSHTEPT